MNYHHIYHAGNFADIFKHIALVLCLEKFHEKPAPFFVLDTHAGIGKYDLCDEKSIKTSEALDGVNKILKNNEYEKFLPQRFIKILEKFNPNFSSEIKTYPGSPMIIKDYLRREDRAIFSELNRQDFIQLRRNFAGNPKFTLLNEDGFALLKSKLPPKQGRGLIIIDPAFEKNESKVSADWDKIILGLQDSYKRFAHGVYLVWHPIIKSDEEVLKNFYKQISKLKFEKKLQLTFDIGAKENETKMTACGMFIFNAPWQLEEKLKVILPQVLNLLKNSDYSRFEAKPIFTTPAAN
jgi:23S rRNA (adenine2030-N6)-methyltransferase